MTIRIIRITIRGMVWNIDETAVELTCEEYADLNRWASMAKDAACRELVLVEVYKQIERLRDIEVAKVKSRGYGLPFAIQEFSDLGIKAGAEVMPDSIADRK